MATHDLKLNVCYWEAVTTGRKTFEVRRDDRGYREGDVLSLKAWDGNSYAPVASEEFAVTYVHAGLGMAPGYVVLGIVPLKPHIIEFRADGWTIQHPISCRPNLFDCPVNRVAERDIEGPPEELGRFPCHLDENGRLVLEVAGEEDAER